MHVSLKLLLNVAKLYGHTNLILTLHKSMAEQLLTAKDSCIVALSFRRKHFSVHYLIIGIASPNERNEATTQTRFLIALAESLCFLPVPVHQNSAEPGFKVSSALYEK